ARTARMVQAGKIDLGLIATRAWDELGVKAFEALQAPFLITNIALLDRVVTGQIGERMIDGLRSTGFVGLGLIPDQLRHPIGFAYPLASLNDFAGARVRIPPSGVTSALIRALGAIPLEIGGADVNAAIDHRRIAGEELSFGNAP